MNKKASPYSNLKLFRHAEKLEALRRNEHVAPIYVRIKPTNICNHNCNYCHYAAGQYLNLENLERNDFIPLEKMLEIISDFSEIGVKAITFSGGGEPLAYRYIIEAMSGFLKNDIELSIITNGSLLNGERADLLKDAKWVRISLDAGTSETYSRIRNIPLNSFEEVCANIKKFSEIKNKNCELGINFVITEENSSEVYKAGKLMKSLGVNHIKYAARITTDTIKYHALFKDSVVEQIHRLSDENESDSFRVVNKYETDFDTCAIFQRQYNKCYMKDLVCVIAADSRIYYCHDKAYLTDGVVGDISKKSFKEVWFSDEVKNMFAEFDPKEQCKHHCVYDSRNMLLNDFYALDENQINFV